MKRLREKANMRFLAGRVTSVESSYGPFARAFTTKGAWFTRQRSQRDATVLVVSFAAPRRGRLQERSIVTRLPLLVRFCGWPLHPAGRGFWRPAVAAVAAVRAHHFGILFRHFVQEGGKCLPALMAQLFDRIFAHFCGPRLNVGRDAWSF